MKKLTCTAIAGLAAGMISAGALALADPPFLYVATAQLRTHVVATKVHLGVKPEFGACQRVSRTHVDCVVAYRHVKTTSPSVFQQCRFTSSVSTTSSGVLARMANEVCSLDTSPTT